MGFHNFLIYCLSAFITLFFKLKLPPDGVCDTDLLICNKTSLITCTAAHSSSSEGGIISLWMSQEWKRVVNFFPLLPVWFLPWFPCIFSGHLQSSRWEQHQFWVTPHAPSAFRWDCSGCLVQSKEFAFSELCRTFQLKIFYCFLIQALRRWCGGRKATWKSPMG